MAEFALRFASSFWMLLLDTGVWLIAGLLLAGVVHVLIPRSVLSRHLSGGGIGPIVKASLLGIPLPLCSCSVIPVAAGLRASGASKGASAAFAISTPQTGEESIPLTWALFGPVYAFTRPVVAVLTAFTAGWLIDRFVGESPRTRAVTPTPAKKSCCEPARSPAPVPGTSNAKAPCCAGGPIETHPSMAAFTMPMGGRPTVEPPPAASCCAGDKATPACCAARPGPDTPPCCASESAPPKTGGRGIEIVRYAFGTLLRDLAPWLGIGLVLSALVAAAVPPGWIESTIGTGLVPMLLMLLVGLPLYVCATSTTPLAYTLVVAGLSPGAALVLLMAGPATNAATMSWVLKDLGARALAIYLATIALFAVAAGWIFDATLRGAVRLAEHGATHPHHAVTLAQSIGAVGFAAVLVWALARRYLPRTGSAAGESQRA
jgi:uncharacterized membrane protein YraQ (UPF0718 family)